MKVYVDADTMRYRIPWAIKPEDFNEGILFSRLKQSVDSICMSCIDHLGMTPERFVWVFSGKYNFRRHVALTKKYKGNRPTVKPKGFEEVPRLLDKALTHEIVMGLVPSQHIVVHARGEADDYLATNAKEGDIIVSNDKDFAQLPHVIRFDWTKPWLQEEDGSYKIDPLAFKCASYSWALYSLYMQMLTGDRVDNITGIPGIGDIKADRILMGVPKEPAELWMAVLDAYEKHYEHPELARMKAIESARLVYLLRYEDDVWNPPELEENTESTEATTSTS